jgi:hypothetical protein
MTRSAGFPAFAWLPAVRDHRPLDGRSEREQPRDRRVELRFRHPAGPIRANCDERKQPDRVAEYGYFVPFSHRHLTSALWPTGADARLFARAVVKLQLNPTVRPRVSP